MTNEFDKQRHRKAFIYTAAICSLLLLAFILISWKTEPPAPPIILDRIEINLGDNNEGFGEEEPEAIGAPAPVKEEAAPNPPQETAAEAPQENITPDDNAEEVAAPIAKPVTKISPKPTPAVIPTIKPTRTPTAQPNPTTKPVAVQKPKILMPNADGPGGLNSKKNKDNKSQGGFERTGNKGVPDGKPAPFGTKPGGSIDGTSVTKGKRKIISVRPYKFPGDLERATIFAEVKVSPDGSGIFLRIAQGSTSTAAAYASAIRGYLQNIKFDAADDDGVVTVRFNFNVD